MNMVFRELFNDLRPGKAKRGAWTGETPAVEMYLLLLLSFQLKSYFDSHSHSYSHPYSYSCFYMYSYSYSTRSAFRVAEASLAEPFATCLLLSKTRPPG